MLPAILICAFMVKNAATQTVTATLGLTKSCVRIGDEVKLICTVSSGCCSSSRIWEKGSAIELLNDGISSLNPSKYVEDYYVGSTRFNLIIKNVQTSDFGVKYKCLYSIFDDDVFLSKDHLCDCWECAKKDYGWSILGDLIGTVIIVIIVIVKIDKTKTVLIVGGVIFIISAVVNLIALYFGKTWCHCIDGTDPWLIVLGLGTSGIIGVIALIYMLKKGSSQGSNGSNEQPLKENKKKKPAAEKSSNEPPLEKKKKKKSAAETGSNEPPLEKKKKKKSAAETGSRSPTAAAKHIKTANNETEMIPTEKGFSGDLEKKRPLPPLTTQLSPTNRPLPLPSSTKPLPSSTRPLPHITTNKGDN